MILKIDPHSVAAATAKVTGPIRNAGPLFTKLVADLERSIRRNFGEGGRPIQWPRSRGAEEENRKTLIARGFLLNSILPRHTGERETVYTRDKRAAIHQFGGVIRPVNAKALTIPIDPLAKNKRARSFDRDQTFLLKRPGKPTLIMLKRAETEGGPIPLYVLMTSVRIPARPFMAPPPRDVEKMEERVREYVKGAVGEGKG